MTIIEKVTEKIQNITHSSESDAQKIIVGLSILGIAISWFIMGQYLSDDDDFIQDEDIASELKKMNNL